ncbi:MAG: transporter substrate-binding domain-containing protein [Oscillospiraceae bacterium]|nr:transporter substrate-binding domain-containing protein [Oscillospiraceae bacterium]
MKKMFATMLALSMCLSLAACGPKSSASTSGSSAGTSASSASGSQTAASDVDYVKEKGTLIVGITDFAPMDYKAEGSDEWIGFDADMAKAFAESLGVEVEFLEINWDNKALELENKGVDAVWNGMTLTDDVKALMATSDPYCLNGQVVVLSADVADQYQTAESLSGLSFAVENGSAGMEQAEAAGLDYVAMDTQAKALMEVASGTSDAAIIDLLMAVAMVGEGTSYPDLTYTVQLSSDEYGVGFRKGSDLAEAFSSFWKEAYDAGTVMEIAEKYGIQDVMIEK